MAAKVGLASVSYGIGVQNRYSAFLEDDDGFGTSVVASASNRQRADHVVAAQVASKQKSPAQSNSASKANGNSSSSSVKASSKQLGAGNKQQSQDQLKSQQDQHQQQQKRVGVVDGKRQRAGQQQPQHLSGNNNNYVQQQQPRQQQANNRQHGNNNQENTANNKIVRTITTNSSNHHHQSNASHHHQQGGNNFYNKENGESGQQHGKFVKNNMNQRPSYNNNRRQFYNEDRINKPGDADGQVSSFANTGVVQSNEDEKRRRQQKRALDLKFKDPEKREARRQQTAAANELSNLNNQPEQQGHGENNGVNNNLGSNNRSQRFNQRRQVGGEGQRVPQGDDATNRSFRGMNAGGRGRGRRLEQGGSTELGPNGERSRDGQQQAQQANRVQRTGSGPGAGDRPQRNRGGFATDSRGSRGSRGDEQGKFEREPDRQKPIPNFSDKLDFPSLAS